MRALGWGLLVVLAGCGGGEPVTSENSDAAAAEGKSAAADGVPAEPPATHGEEGHAAEGHSADAHGTEGHAEGHADAHAAESPPPEAFVEASYMVPPGKLRQFLVIISGACDERLAPEQLSQALAAAGGMMSGDARQLTFPVNFRGKAAEFEMTLFLDDPAVLEVILFGPPGLVDALSDLADEAVLALDLRGLQ